MTVGTYPINVIYFGTPDYAVPTLRMLAADERYRVTLVVTQPDREARRGRRMQLEQPAVKRAAIELGLPVYQPERLRTVADRAPLIDLNPDLFVVAAYGLIFGPTTLGIPKHGCLNLHASILPSYRGASPISAAIASGDAETGVTLMQMDAGMDTGDIVDVRRLAIAEDDTTGSLTNRLAALGAELARDSIPPWVEGRLTAIPQYEEEATLVRPLVKADGWIDWSRPAEVIERLVRAMLPWPAAWTTLPDGATLRVLRAGVDGDTELPPGVLAIRDRLVLVGTGCGSLRITRLQPAGGQEMDAAAFAQGRRMLDGGRLGETGAPQRPTIPMIRQAD